ncbi:MAG: small ribosomal subunit biogenesis GTPase RsgA [Porticoccaceae bacterium]
MSKRHLTKQQQRRIQRNQDKASAAADQRQAEETLATADLGPEQNGRVVACFGSQVDVESDPPVDGAIRRCHLRANLPTIVTGDKVIWQDGEPQGVVVAAKPRHSELCRPDGRGRLRPVAANIDRIAVVIAPLPEPHRNLIDRYLVAAEHQGITPMLVMNKSDLVDDLNRTTLFDMLADYAALGYDCIQVSARSGDSLGLLADQLDRITSVFVGQSGVGKSSLLNALAPGTDTAVGDLSEAVTKGTHTTTTARLFHLPNGGEVIDSPGIREFGLWHLEPTDVASGFTEFRPFLGHCKFRDCQHRGTEPGCAVEQALANGQLTQQRVDSYRHILQSLETGR